MIPRISREVCFMEMAQVLSKRSTCMRRAVGALITVDNRIVSTGWNGAPAGQPHCDGGKTCTSPGLMGCQRAKHAEANAIEYMASGFNNIAKTMFTTESPCIACASIIDRFAFSKVYYLHEYRDPAGIKYLLLQGMQVFRMTPAGMIMRKILDDDLLIEEAIEL